LSGLETRSEIDSFSAELVDRFGELPLEVRHLLDVMEIKGLCRQAGIAQVDAGPKGAVVAFRRNAFSNPEGLVAVMQKARNRMKLQADHKLVFKADWDLPEHRLKGVRKFIAELAEVAAKGRKPA
jgi:transcription-repair coupling factor (superfamily II helicase)